MYLILIRHGSAESKSHGSDDFHRSLTKEGIEEAKLAGKLLKKLGMVPKLILSSPLVRAKQTAEAAGKILGLSDEVMEIDDNLAPEGDIDDLLRDLTDRFCDNDIIALFGHQPFLGELMSRLVFGRVIDDMPLAKGGVAIFQIDGSLTKDQQKMVFLSTPREAQRLLS